jgi:pyruvate/2-oxoglutarate/acetoin dehydrogenase E1 component
MRVTLPDAPAPASSVLEKVYYPSSESIVSAVRKILKA